MGFRFRSVTKPKHVLIAFSATSLIVVVTETDHSPTLAQGAISPRESPFDEHLRHFLDHPRLVAADIRMIGANLQRYMVCQIQVYGETENGF